MSKGLRLLYWGLWWVCMAGVLLMFVSIPIDISKADWGQAALDAVLLLINGWNVNSIARSYKRLEKLPPF